MAIRQNLANSNMAYFHDVLAKNYGNRGPFVTELTVTLQYCLEDKETEACIKKIEKLSNLLNVLKIDKELMIIEELFCKSHVAYQVIPTHSLTLTCRNPHEFC